MRDNGDYRLLETLLEAKGSILLIFPFTRENQIFEKILQPIKKNKKMIMTYTIGHFKEILNNKKDIIIVTNDLLELLIITYSLVINKNIIKESTTIFYDLDSIYTSSIVTYGLNKCSIWLDEALSLISTHVKKALFLQPYTNRNKLFKSLSMKIMLKNISELLEVHGGKIKVLRAIYS
ncbi:MAG: hypothetical protein DRJ98_04830 [Thermoprotei archaeon]|nr:MAG: hypothetical protein DRJ52_03315 [Thermoprotei archaeon]RLF10952.1 MAG: hypothetical protein DRJ98_04830 [Thermoprotei archaeon]